MSSQSSPDTSPDEKTPKGYVPLRVYKREREEKDYFASLYRCEQKRSKLLEERIELYQQRLDYLEACSRRELEQKTQLSDKRDSPTSSPPSPPDSPESTHTHNDKNQGEDEGSKHSPALHYASQGTSENIDVQVSTPPAPNIENTENAEGHEMRISAARSETRRTAVHLLDGSDSDVSISSDQKCPSKVLSPCREARINDTQQEDSSAPHRQRTSPLPVIDLCTDVPSINSEADSWQEHLSEQDIRVFRLRQFQRDCITKLDPHGAAPAHWAIERGYVACEARSLPPTITSSEEARDFFRRPTAEMLDAVRDSPSWQDTKPGAMTHYSNSYAMFARMRAGDVVALQVREGTKKGMFYFGIVADDSLLLQTAKEMANEGFPSMHLFEKAQIFKCGRMLLKRIRWVRKAYARKLPNQKVSAKGSPYCNWLLESGSPCWIADVTGKDSIEIMKTDEFMHASESLHNEGENIPVQTTLPFI